jgi:ABC-2 type transport system permease protein
VHLSSVDWTWTAWGTLLFAVLGGVALFSGILVLQATLAFWTVESLEIANTLTYGGVEAGQYPLDIYARWFRNFPHVVVPLACIAYLSGRVGAGSCRAARVSRRGYCRSHRRSASCSSPFALWVWGFGVRRYTSTGS